MKGNYLNVLKKRVKTCLKGKFRITLALIVSLMINGVVIAAEEKLDFDENTLSLDWESDADITSDKGFGVSVMDQTYIYPGDEEGVLTSKIEVNLNNKDEMNVTNKLGGDSSGIYIPATDKLSKLDSEGENSYFKVKNTGSIDVTGKSAYGIKIAHLPTTDEEDGKDNYTIPTSSSHDDDTVYAYPDIDIANGGQIIAKGNKEAEGVKIDGPFATVEVTNSEDALIRAEVGKVEDGDDFEKEGFGGASGINLLIPTEVDETDEAVSGTQTYSKDGDEEGIESTPMDIDIVNNGSIEVSVENKEVARIMGINIGEYDDHTLLDTTEIVTPEKVTPASAVSSINLEGEDAAISQLSSDHGNSGGNDGDKGDSSCGGKPLDAMVFNDITNNGDIIVRGNNLSAVQAVGINSRMSEGTQGTFINNGAIDVEVTMKGARQTDIVEDPTSGNLYGINVFNSGRPARVDTFNNGDIRVKGMIVAEDDDNKSAEAPVGIQAFGINNKARGRDAVADVNNQGNIYVEAIENQNTEDMDYTYILDTEGKEIFGARAVGIRGTSAGRAAYTEVTNGDYDFEVDTKAMDALREGGDIVVYDEIVSGLKEQYEEHLEDSYTYDENKEGASIVTIAKSENGYAEAKGIWATAEAIENAQFVYNSEGSRIVAKAEANERGAEALGIESVSYQNTVINKGLIDIESNGKTATGIGILAEISEIEEDEDNEHGNKPANPGEDVARAQDLSLDGDNGNESGSNGSDSDNDTDNTTGSGGSDDTSQPEMGMKNKYVLNTGTINVNVNKETEDSESEKQEKETENDFAFGAGIVTSRLVSETVTGTDRLEDFRAVEPLEILKSSMAALSETASNEELDGEAGATTDEGLNQYITNNGFIGVNTSGDTALASGISALTKVEVVFDIDDISDDLDSSDSSQDTSEEEALEVEEVVINTELINNGKIVVNALSEAENGKAIANGMATDVVWDGFQKPVYEDSVNNPSVEAYHSETGGSVIEKNYENFVNSEGAWIKATATATDGTAAAFGMRIGNYYVIDDAASERTALTKHYAGDYEEEKEEDGGLGATEYGLENAGTIIVKADGKEAKAFGMVSGSSKEIDDGNEEFVVSTIKNSGKIGVEVIGDENSEGIGIAAFADQQIEYLTETSEDEDILDPEKAVVIVENAGDIVIEGDTKNKYGIYAEINKVDDTSQLTEGTYKVGETYLEVKNEKNGRIYAEEGVGIYLGSEGTVINDGTIVAEKAIVTSEGEDRVLLNSGSVTIGDIETGAGDDVLELHSGSIVKGNIDLGSGDDKLLAFGGGKLGDKNYTIDGGDGNDEMILTGSEVSNWEEVNAIDSKIIGFEEFQIQGEWKLDVNAKIDVGKIVVGEDSTIKLKLQGDVDKLEATSIKASDIFIDGKMIAGIKDVDKQGRSSFTHNLGEKFTTTSGDKVDIKTSTYAWNVEIVDENIQQVEEETSKETSALAFERVEFDELANDDTGIASALDNAYGNSELERVFDALENEVLSTSVDEATAKAQLNEALENISGTEYAAYPFINLSISRAFSDNAKWFMESGERGQFIGEKSSRINDESDRGLHQYVNLLGNSGDFDGSGSENFDFDSYGVILATEKELDANHRIALTYGYADTSIDFDNGGSGETDTFHVGGYHKYEKEQWIVKSILAFDYNQNDVERVVNIGNERFKPSSDFDSYVMSIGTEVGYDYPVGDWFIRPMTGVTYSRVEQDSIKEDTAAGIGKSSESYNSFVSEVGLRAIKEFGFENTRLKLYFGVSWLHEYGDIYDSQNQKYAGSSYSIDGLDVGDDTYRAETGIEAQTNDKWSFNVRYIYDGESSYDGHRISIGAKYTF